MPNILDFSAVPRKDLPIFYVLDTSGSMAGTKISSLNQAVEETIATLNTLAQNNADAKFKIAVLEFNTKPKWATPNGLENIEDFIWTRAKAGGRTKVGAALDELNLKLSRKEFLNSEMGTMMPVIIFMTDGLPTDDYKIALAKIRKNKWFKRAIKIGIAIGEEADKVMVSEVVGNSEAVIQVNDMDLFGKLVRFVTVQSSMLSSVSQTRQSKASGSVIVEDAIKSLKMANIAKVNLPDGTYSKESESEDWDEWDDWEDDNWDDIESGYIRTRNSRFSDSKSADIEVSSEFSNKISEDKTINNDFTIEPEHGMPSVKSPDRQGDLERPQNESLKASLRDWGSVGSKEAISVSEVEFSAVAPKALQKGEYALINIVMYEKQYRSEVDRLLNSEEDLGETKSGIVKVTEKSKVKIKLSSPEIEIDGSEEERVWDGGYLNFSFFVGIPEDYRKKQVLFTASVYINGLLATRLRFVARCKASSEQKIAVEREDIMSAFVSYASQDRWRVANVVQGMRKARPDLDLFFDVENLRSGQNWEKALWNEIDSRDILYLCWSHNAKASEWVDKEWRYALNHKGLEGIEPIPLDPPNVCPPPEELKAKHFNDLMLFIVQASEDSFVWS